MPPGPSKHSPLPNPFFTGGGGGGYTGKSPRSSLSGKDSLGRIPSMSSLKSTAERMNSPARRMSSSLASVASGPVSASENERPRGLQLGKHYHSYDDLALAQDPAAAPSVKRRSPRKLPKISLQTSAEDLDALLAVQRTLFSLRTKVSELAELGDYFSAHHWLSRLLTDPVLGQQAHWSDHYRFLRLGLQQGQPAKLLLEAFREYETTVAGPLNAHMTVLHAELLARLQDWETLWRLLEAVEVEGVGEARAPPPGRNWDREQFPERWLPAAGAGALRGRLCQLRGLALRHLGRFEQAIDAFDLATQHDPYQQAAVAEMVYEARALIPAGQRQQYLETLALPPALRHSPDLETLFGLGQYERVLAATRPHVTSARGLAGPDDRLLVLHLGCLLGLRRADELLVLGHRLVELLPQRAVTWYAVGLYYEAVGRHDDARRYLMKACSKEEAFGPAWLMLGHSFARSGDHDQAVSAYALLARHTAPGSLPPRLFLAMEFLRTKQTQAASLYLLEAFHADRGNAWVMNEVAAMYSLQRAYPKAIAMLAAACTACRRQEDPPPPADLLATLLANTVAVYLKLFAACDNLPLEAGAALRVVEELLARAGPPSRLPPRALANCAAVLEVKAGLAEDPDAAAAFYGRAADLYHQAVLLAGPQQQDKAALLGYNRCLVLKVQNSALPDAPPPLEDSDNSEAGDDDDDMALDSDTGSPAPGPLAPHLVTPVKAFITAADVESPAASELPTASRPPTLRRRLTSLSFTDLDQDSD